MSVLITLGACGKLRKSRTQSVHPYDGGDMINVPIDQSVLYGIWKNDDINAVIEVSGDKPHMIVTENGKLIFEGYVRLQKFGDLVFTDGKGFGLCFLYQEQKTYFETYCNLRICFF